MRHFPHCMCALGVALASFAILFLPASANLGAAELSTSDLVQAALKTELDGPSEARKQLLDEALRRDPDFAPARWQSGFVRFDGEWLKVEDVPRRARGIEHLAEYRKLRDKLIDTADNHRALARWCHENKLPDEERVHWAKVLEFEHTDAEAIEALGLQLYNGRLMTKSQIDAEKKQAGEARRALQRWQPQFVKWRKAIEHGNPKQLDEALRGLKDLADPSAIPALEAVFAVNGEAPKHIELNKLLIDTVGRMPVPEATQVLLRRAIVPNSLEVRTAAADELKKRPMHSFVPALLLVLVFEIEDEFQVSTRWVIYPLSPYTIVHRHLIVLRDSRQTHFVGYDSLFTSVNDEAGDPNGLLDIYGYCSNLLQNAKLPVLLSEATAIENNVEQIAQQAAATNRLWCARIKNRVQTVLDRATPFDADVDKETLLARWNEYCESYSAPPAPTESSWQYHTQWRNVSCFPAGTPILTASGLAPIEKVKIGDRVLAQDAKTGALSYQLVLATTLRPASPLVEIGLGSESIRATRGHPFWVCGQGWLMAKQLEPGMRLHSINGAVTVDRIEDSSASEAYNLVVGEFGTYFVGENRLLVHDNLLMKETTAVVPGLSTEAGLVGSTTPSVR